MADTLSRARVPSADLGNQTSETLFTTITGATLTCAIPVLDNKNKPLLVRAGGRITSGTSQNFTARLYFSTTLNATTVIADATAVVVADLYKMWLLEAVICCVESNPAAIGTIDLSFLNSEGTQSSVIQTDNPDLSGAVISITGQFASSDSGNVAFVDFFEIQGMVS